MNFNEAVEQGSELQADMEYDESQKCEGITFKTQCSHEELNAVMDLVGCLHEYFEEGMDWLSLPLQGRLKKEDVVITVSVKKQVETELEVVNAQLEEHKTKLNVLNDAERGLEVLEHIMDHEDPDFEDFQKGMDALYDIVKHYAETTQVDPATGKEMCVLLLTEAQVNDLDRIMENEERIQSEQHEDYRSPMVTRFYGESS